MPRLLFGRLQPPAQRLQILALFIARALL